VVIKSGTTYEPSTLVAQVQAVLSGPSRPGTAPSAALRGCVANLTAGRSPRLVDQAVYQHTPVYVIASSNSVFVVETTCTEANLKLITTTQLTG
jgi:hypothetical protein